MEAIVASAAPISHSIARKGSRIASPHAVRLSLQTFRHRRITISRGIPRRAVAPSPIMSLDVERDEARFPFLSQAGREVVINASKVLRRALDHLLEDSNTPEDVRYFKSEDGSAEGSVVLRPGKADSKVDFFLESWLHATVQFGRLDIATLVVMLGPETDSPHFLFELIQSGPTLVVVLDHLPRKDLVVNPEYLKRFYDTPGLDKVRVNFEETSNAKPYISPVLFIRSVVSPTAVMYKLSGSPKIDGGSLKEHLETVVFSGAERIAQAWVESFSTSGGSDFNEGDLLIRDAKIKTMGIEVDLSANLPRLFGAEISERIVDAYRKGSRIKS